MAATGLAKPVAVGALYVAPLSTDSASAHTYGTLVQLSGLQEFTVDPDTFEAILEAEGKKDEVFVKLQGANGSIKLGYIDLTGLQAALNEDAVAAVTGPPAGKALHVDADSYAGYVGIFFKPLTTAGAAGGEGDKDLHVLIGKAKLKLGQMQHNTAFSGVTLNYTGIPRKHDQRVINLVSLDTAAAITATTADA